MYKLFKESKSHVKYNKCTRVHSFVEVSKDLARYRFENNFVEVK